MEEGEAQEYNSPQALELFLILCFVSGVVEVGSDG